ncbi:MAG: carbohydrate porin [Porphyromonadaceae bacterium]|nr:carbohydrate porin [Porphyromonadaceae bacterium]
MKIKWMFLFLGCLLSTETFCQIAEFSGEYASEWQWNMGHDKATDKTTNWVNFLRLDASLSPWESGSFDVATLSVVKTNETIINDWQTFSNIEDENNVLMIAVLGYMQTFERAHLFVGVRNVNEDYFTSECTSFFTNSSPGIFPTIYYPIANYPLSSLGIHFDVSWNNWTLKSSVYSGTAYNGWKKGDNPFVFRPKHDGFFTIHELSYTYDKSSYFVGITFHNKRFIFDDEGEVADVKTHLSCAWWLYGEQLLWEGNDQDLFLMAQYSENTDKKADCYRYAELGAIYNLKDNRIGASQQFAQYLAGKEWSTELTYYRDITKFFAVQPTFQYIRNGEGNFTVLCARVYLTF